MQALSLIPAILGKRDEQTGLYPVLHLKPGDCGTFYTYIPNHVIACPMCGERITIKKDAEF